MTELNNRIYLTVSGKRRRISYQYFEQLFHRFRYSYRSYVHAQTLEKYIYNSHFFHYRGMQARTLFVLAINNGDLKLKLSKLALKSANLLLNDC
jgi:hypothetical protein